MVISIKITKTSLSINNSLISKIILPRNESQTVNNQPYSSLSNNSSNKISNTNINVINQANYNSHDNRVSLLERASVFQPDKLTRQSTASFNQIPTLTNSKSLAYIPSNSSNNVLNTNPYLNINTDNSNNNNNQQLSSHYPTIPSESI